MKKFETHFPLVSKYVDRRAEALNRLGFIYDGEWWGDCEAFLKLVTTYPHLQVRPYRPNWQGGDGRLCTGGLRFSVGGLKRESLSRHHVPRTIRIRRPEVDRWQIGLYRLSQQRKQVLDELTAQAQELGMGY